MCFIDRCFILHTIKHFVHGNGGSKILFQLYVSSKHKVYELLYMSKSQASNKNVMNLYRMPSLEKTVSMLHSFEMTSSRLRKNFRCWILWSELIIIRFSEQRN